MVLRVPAGVAVAPDSLRHLVLRLEVKTVVSITFWSIYVD